MIMKSIYSSELSDFMEIYSANVELVCISPPDSDIQALSYKFIESKKYFNLSWIMTTESDKSSENALREVINPVLRSNLFNYIQISSNLLGKILGCNKFQVRLDKIGSPMCPLFHIDRISCRLLITLCGEGTEWISNSDVDWDIFSDRKNKCIPIKNGRFINKFKVGQWSLLKGSVWGNNYNGVVHRSPNKIGNRLLLSLDPIFD